MALSRIIKSFSDTNGQMKDADGWVGVSANAECLLCDAHGPSITMDNSGGKNFTVNVCLACIKKELKNHFDRIIRQAKRRTLEVNR